MRKNMNKIAGVNEIKISDWFSKSNKFLIGRFHHKPF